MPSDHLHLGCGQNAPKDWLNVDGSWQIVLARHPSLKRLLTMSRLLPREQAEIPWSRDVLRINLAGPLPFPDKTFSAIYCSHMLEHLYYDDACRLLHECHRVLQSKGTCRFVVPDLESILTRYQEAKTAGNQEASKQFMDELSVHDRHRRRGTLGFYYRLTAFHQHKWMYDAASLQKLFSHAGFIGVRQAEYLDSGIVRIAEVESAGRILNGEGVAVEGSKE